MFVCLSSGSTPRYREDILRSLAMPVGTILQFRYERRYLTQAVSTAVEDGRAESQTALVVYVDQNNPAVPPSYVPCRFAEVRRVTSHGTTLSLELALGHFGFADNLLA